MQVKPNPKIGPLKNFFYLNRSRDQFSEYFISNWTQPLKKWVPWTIHIPKIVQGTRNSEYFILQSTQPTFKGPENWSLERFLTFESFKGPIVGIFNIKLNTTYPKIQRNLAERIFLSLRAAAKRPTKSLSSIILATLSEKKMRLATLKYTTVR